MKRLLTATLALAMLGLATAAGADGRDHRDHRRDRHERYEHRDYRENGRRAWNDYRHSGERHVHHPSRVHYRYETYHRPAGYRYRVWRYGDRLPVTYRTTRYYVTDYHHYRLRPPPLGYHWVRVDDDVLLTALATGLVVQVVHGLFH